MTKLLLSFALLLYFFFRIPCLLLCLEIPVRENTKPDITDRVTLKFFVLFCSRDSVSDPYSAELKGSPRFGSVSTTYKTVLSQDEEARQNQPHSSGESKFSASFKHAQRATLFFLCFVNRAAWYDPCK